MTATVREPVLLTSDDQSAVAGFGIATGWAHETPRLRGVTDRAMQWLAATPGVTAHWHVDALITYFWVSGSPRAVRIGLGDVLRQARRPPVPPRLTQTTPAPDADAALLVRRWGLRGFGLQGWDRLGFVAADAADLEAVLTHLGPGTLQLFAINADVDAAMVPDGGGAPRPDPAFPPLAKLPVLLDAEAGFAMSWHVPRRDLVAEGLVRLAVAEAIEATPALGQTDSSVGTEAQWLSRRLGSQGSHTAIMIPSGLSDDATSHLADRLRHWASAGPDESDLGSVSSPGHERRHESPWDLVRSAVEESLLAADAQSFEEPTQPDVRLSMTTIRDSLLVLAPERSTATRLAPIGSVAAPEPIAGDDYRCVPLIRRGERRRVVVTAGAEGVALRSAAGLSVIRRPDVAVVQRWPGGQLQVTAVDGRQLTLDPAELHGGDRMSAHVAGLAPEAMVDHPAARPASASLVKAYRQAGGWALTAVVLMAPAAMLACLLLLGAIAESEPGGDRVGFAVVGIVFATLAALAGWRAVRLRRVGRAIGLGAWGQPLSTTGRSGRRSSS